MTPAYNGSRKNMHSTKFMFVSIILTILSSICLHAETISHYSNPLEVTTGNPNVFKEGSVYYLLNRHQRKKSTDLIHWQSMDDWIDVEKAGLTEVWASQMVKVNNQYYLYFSAKTPISGNLHVVCVASSPSITGTFEILAAPMWWDGSGYIDPYVFIDGSKRYIYFTYQKLNSKSNGNAKIYVAELKNNMHELKTDMKFCIKPSQSWERGWQEAAHMLKYKGLYYLSWSSECFSGPNYSVGYATSRSPLGPWKKAPENPILKKVSLPEGRAVGTGAMCFVRSPDDSELLGIYFSHSKLKTNGPRQLSMDRVSFEKNPKGPDRLTVSGPTLNKQPFPSGATPKTVMIGKDDFNGNKLMDRWVNIWNDNPRKYKISDGALSIIPGVGNLREKREGRFSQNIFMQYAPQSNSHRSRAHVLLPKAAKPVFAYMHYWQDPQNYLQFKLFKSSEIKIEQMVDDKLTVHTENAATRNIRYLEISRDTESRKFQFSVKSNQGKWELLSTEIPDRFKKSKILKCGIGAGVEGDKRTSPAIAVKFYSYEIGNDN